MKLRFFTDYCIPTLIVRALLNKGHEVFILRDYIPIDSIDSVVIDKAQELDSILVSLNGDFSDIVTYPPSKYKGIISLKVKNHPENFPLILEKLLKFISDHPDMNYFTGKMFQVEVHRIRIKK